MHGAGEQSRVVTAGPWVARDAFVAETAVRLDRLAAMISKLEREAEVSRHQVSELVDIAGQANRFQALETSLRNAREYKLDELLRCIKESKARLDVIEGNRSKFAGLTYQSIESIDVKLNELTAFEAKLERLERNVKFNAALFCGAVFLLVSAAVVRFL